MTVGGVVVTFVTVTVPLAFVITRIGTTTRADAAVRVVDAVVDDAVVVVAVVVVAVPVLARVPSGGLTARVGPGVTDDVSVGVRRVVLVPLAADVVVGPAANWPGVAEIAAVIGVASVLVIVGVVAIAAVVGVAVAALGVESAGATVAAAVVPAVPVVVPAPTASRKTAASVVEPPVTTGTGCELMDAFTVACGFAYADGGMN
jgi:hypothetical protein